jgi:deoxyhypusine monooxygenase
MQNKVAIPALINRLDDTQEHVMVRHEAAEAMGAIGDLSVREVLERHLHDKNPEVSESCEVALDLLAWCNTDEWGETKW